MSTENEAFRELAIQRVFQAMTDGYADAWEIGCWEHGTGQRFAEIAVDALAALSDELNIPVALGK